MTTEPSKSKAKHDLRWLFLLLSRRRFMLLGPVLATVLIAYVALAVIPAQYTARSYIKVETRPELSDPLAYVISEAETIRSRSLLREVILSPRLSTIPAYRAIQNEVKSRTPHADSQGLKSPAAMGVNAQPIENLSTDVLNPELSKAIDDLRAQLDVEPVPGSFVVQLEVRRNDKAQAALIANALAEIYVQKKQPKTTRQPVESEQDRQLLALLDQLKASEKAVDAYKQANNLLPPPVALPVQVSPVGQAIPVTPMAVPIAAPSRLQESEAALSRHRAKLATRYGPKHPAMRAVEAELRTVRAKLAREREGVKAAMPLPLIEKPLSTPAAANAVPDTPPANTALLGLKDLERTAEDLQRRYDVSLKRYQPVPVAPPAILRAEIISYATVPATPSYPDRAMFIACAILLGLLAGAIWIGLVEKMDNTFRTGADVEEETGFPCYGLVPQVPPEKDVKTADYVQRKPTSPATEALRTLRMSLSLRGQQITGEKPKTVAVTSSVTDEGKSTLAYWLARQSAKSGEKVILIDCDLRKPSLHGFAKRHSGPTLIDFLLGEAKLEEVIVRDDLTGLHIITARAVPNTALDLLQSDTMGKLLVSLKSVYDLVILDTPAALPVTDARWLALHSDAVLHVVRWNHTKRDAVLTSLRQLTAFGYTRVGTVINRVDLSRHAAYGYGDVASYYGAANYHSA